MLSESPEVAAAAGWSTEEVYFDYMEGGQLKGGKVEIPAGSPGLSAEFVAAAPNWNVVTLRNSGDPANRVDITLVGDGYTAADIPTYASNSEDIIARMFSEEPLSRYASLFNVHRVDVISNESGVDNDPTQGVLKDTALDMQFFCGGTARLICVNITKAKAAASEAPGADQILAVANSTTYGGAGYASSDVGTLSGSNISSVETALHELGHSFADLADEYFYTPATTWTGGEASAANVSIYQAAQMSSLETKWHR
jgi:hypothetical protein